jgi:hypothetical protein
VGLDPAERIQVGGALVGRTLLQRRPGALQACNPERRSPFPGRANR